MNIYIAYFSGTGGTARAAKSLADAFEDRGASVVLQEIRAGVKPQNGQEDALVLLYAVYALNAPQPVYCWLKELSCSNGTPAAVIAVSGGGEMFPNTACRLGSIRRLRKKGYTVTYEDNIVMPSNVLVQTPGGAAFRLLQVLPKKTAQLAEDILAGRSKKLKAGFFDRILSRMCETEKYGARWFGTGLFADNGCNGCGWCVDNCTNGNIRMENEKPVFLKNCCFCLKCIYGCPVNAIKAKHLRSLIFKKGFDIDAIAESAKTYDGGKDDLPKGAAWKGVRKYLEEADICE